LVNILANFDHNRGTALGKPLPRSFKDYFPSVARDNEAIKPKIGVHRPDPKLPTASLDKFLNSIRRFVNELSHFQKRFLDGDE
jgi:hypothetical protein